MLFGHVERKMCTSEKKCTNNNKNPKRVSISFFYYFFLFFALFLLKCSTCKYLLRFHSFSFLFLFLQKQMVKAKDISDHSVVCFYCIWCVIYNLLPFHNTHADNTNKLSILTGRESIASDHAAIPYACMHAVDEMACSKEWRKSAG